MPSVLDAHDLADLSKAGKSARKKARIPFQIETSHVICELNAGFWVSQIGHHYVDKHARLSQARRVFMLDNSYDLGRFAADSDRIRNIRNRVAHHEPIIGTPVEAAFALLSRAMTALRVDTWHIGRHHHTARHLVDERLGMVPP